MFIPFSEIKAAIPVLQQSKRVTLFFECGHAYKTCLPASVPNEEINKSLNKIHDIGGDEEHLSRCISVLIEE